MSSTAVFWQIWATHFLSLHLSWIGSLQLVFIHLPPPLFFFPLRKILCSQNTCNAKRLCSAQGNSRPEKTEGAVLLIPSSWPLSVLAHQSLILDLGGVVPVTLFQLNGVYSLLSPLRELSQWLGCWGFGVWECSPVSQSDRGSMEKGNEDLLLGKKAFMLRGETQVLVSSAYDT